MDILQHAIDAVSAGSLFALLALGLALLFSVMGLMNFAYGELIMVAGYTMLVLQDRPAPVIIGGTLMTVVLASVLLERLAFRPVRGASPTTLLVTSFAVSIALQHLARMTLGPEAKGVRVFEFLNQAITVGSLRVTYLALVTTATSVGLIVALTFLLQRTRTGIQLRAASEDFEIARALGVPADRVIVGAFVITGVIAALVGLLFIARTGTVSPTVGTAPLIVAFVGAVIGGMGSLAGAALGGFALGATLTTLRATLPGELGVYTEAFAYAAVIALLLVRPRGLIVPRAAR